MSDKTILFPGSNIPIVKKNDKIKMYKLVTGEVVVASCEFKMNASGSPVIFMKDSMLVIIQRTRGENSIGIALHPFNIFAHIGVDPKNVNDVVEIGSDKVLHEIDLPIHIHDNYIQQTTGLVMPPPPPSIIS